MARFKTRLEQLERKSKLKKDTEERKIVLNWADAESQEPPKPGTIVLSWGDDD